MKIVLAQAHRAALAMRHTAVCRARAVRAGAERGDIPGWVLVTLMTAGLVSVIWAVANDQLIDLFNRAMDSVTGP
jgi:hypothetical protein